MAFFKYKCTCGMVYEFYGKFSEVKCPQCEQVNSPTPFSSIHVEKFEIVDKVRGVVQRENISDRLRERKEVYDKKTATELSRVHGLSEEQFGITEDDSKQI